MQSNPHCRREQKKYTLHCSNSRFMCVLMLLQLFFPFEMLAHCIKTRLRKIHYRPHPFKWLLSFFFPVCIVEQ